MAVLYKMPADLTAISVCVTKWTRVQAKQSISQRQRPINRDRLPDIVLLVELSVFHQCFSPSTDVEEYIRVTNFQHDAVALLDVYQRQ
jgi:hypothetical protein